jgi:hypothetical protein
VTNFISSVNSQRSTQCSTVIVGDMRGSGDGRRYPSSTTHPRLIEAEPSMRVAFSNHVIYSAVRSYDSVYIMRPLLSRIETFLPLFDRSSYPMEGG